MDNQPEAEPYTRIESVETDVRHMLVRWERKTLMPSGRTKYHIAINMGAGMLWFTPRELMEVYQKALDMLRSLGGMEGGIPSD